ncbi:hypothetical protein BDF14DRAFT_1722050, partial [Spinellus fusiger]
HFIRYFDDKQRATLQDAVDDLKKSFKGIEIQKSRVAEFMKEKCSLLYKKKRIFCHSVVTNSIAQLKKRAIGVEEWTRKEMHYLENCILLDESGFNINMSCGKNWSRCGEPAIIATTPSTKTVSYNIFEGGRGASILLVL